MTSNEPQRTAELAGPPTYREGEDTGLGVPVAPAAERAGNGAGTDTLRRLDLRDFLAAVLRVFAEDDGAGKVLAGPFPMRAGGQELTPDVLFVSTEHLDRFTPDGLNGPADFVLQIAAQDAWDQARRRLEAAGVREYWLITPDGAHVERHGRGDEGAYSAVRSDTSGTLRGAVLPLFWLRPEWLSARPLPLVRTVLIEWGLPRLFAD